MSTGNSKVVVDHEIVLSSSEKAVLFLGFSDSVSENRDVEAPVSERNRGMNEELRGDPLHDSTETMNKNKNGEREEVQRYIA